MDTKFETILIIDDNEEILDLLSYILKKEYNIIQALNINEAKSILANCQINCAITDIEMPEGSGLELIKYMAIKHPEIPISILSGSKLREHAILAIKYGAIDYIDKPFNDDQIFHIVHSMIEINKRNLVELDLLTRLEDTAFKKLVYAQKMKRMFRLDRKL